MKKINNKGFTLVELLATVVILALVMGIGAYSIITIVKNSQKNDYKLLISEINNSVELYYQECKYSQTGDIVCPNLVSGYYNTTLGDLVRYGYLKGNGTKEDKKITIVNPQKNNNDISDCNIKYRYNNGKIEVLENGQNSTNSCPTSY